MRLQSIESAIRSAILRGAVAVARGPRPAALPDWSSGPFRVLMVRDDGLGDMIVSLAVMHAIVRAHPTIQLDVLASPQNAPIARRAGFFHEVIEHRRGSFARSRKLWRLLRRPCAEQQKRRLRVDTHHRHAAVDHGVVASVAKQTPEFP